MPAVKQPIPTLISAQWTFEFTFGTKQVYDTASLAKQRIAPLSITCHENREKPQ